VPVTGGTPVKLNHALDTDANIYDWQFSPDSSYLAYMAYGGPGEGADLYTIPPDRTREPRQIGGELGQDGSIGYFELGPDGKRIIFNVYSESRSSARLYHTWSDGGTPTLLDAPRAAGGSIDNFELSPDGRRVVYRADLDIDEVTELYASALPDEDAPRYRLFVPSMMH
jgi:Tol biopolymer transport system component